jgi:hypothetical protein
LSIQCPGYGYDGTGFESHPGKDNFSFPYNVQTFFKAHPSLLYNRYKSYFQREKRPQREANHSPPPRTEVKNEWSYTSTPLYAFLMECRGTFYLYLRHAEFAKSGRVFF